MESSIAAYNGSRLMSVVSLVSAPDNLLQDVDAVVAVHVIRHRLSAGHVRWGRGSMCKHLPSPEGRSGWNTR